MILFLQTLFSDPDVWDVTLLSLKVSGLATLISLMIGLPLGTLLALAKFPGRSFLLTVINTGMALPPVVVGLAVAMTLWRFSLYLYTNRHHHCTDHYRRAGCERADRRCFTAA